MAEAARNDANESSTPLPSTPEISTDVETLAERITQSTRNYEVALVNLEADLRLGVALLNTTALHDPNFDSLDKAVQDAPAIVLDNIWNRGSL